MLFVNILCGKSYFGKKSVPFLFHLPTLKLSSEASSKPFFDRLDIFLNARLLKITLVLLVFGEIHYLPSLRASLDRELTQRRFSFSPNRLIPDAKKNTIHKPGAGEISRGDKVAVCTWPASQNW